MFTICSRPPGGRYDRDEFAITLCDDFLFISNIIHNITIKYIIIATTTYPLCFAKQLGNDTPKVKSHDAWNKIGNNKLPSVRLYTHVYNIDIPMECIIKTTNEVPYCDVP